ncbi:SUKH-3 domain-containing protein [Actinoplanes sp. NPDC026670]|uniref:SUKH-3 domain-containing protein n=1 Tax=Actinoplanes sp. NPDC026670 TaxID=3154700 RepID=UPI0033DBE12E
MMRFGSDLLAALTASGWSAARSVDPGQWVEPLLREGHRLHPLAEEVITSFGGLSIPPVNEHGPNFSNHEPFSVDPLAAGAGQLTLVAEVERVLGGQYFPIAEWLSYSSVFLDAGGRVIAAGMGWFWELGTSFEQALELAVLANRPLICRYSDPGVDPWPPDSAG